MNLRFTLLLCLWFFIFPQKQHNIWFISKTAGRNSHAHDIVNFLKTLYFVFQIERERKSKFQEVSHSFNWVRAVHKQKRNNTQQNTHTHAINKSTANSYGTHMGNKAFPAAIKHCATETVAPLMSRVRQRQIEPINNIQGY